ncbi:hypothetical protein VTJ49DRAFT_191 [Mycothermus thermophilus]|uniref:Uncharacterized protein n=1 Tax=Humicola insolens TaxID=85995 RepID=A0ABR3VG35_HUMIN
MKASTWTLLATAAAGLGSAASLHLPRQTSTAAVTTTISNLNSRPSCSSASRSSTAGSTTIGDSIPDASLNANDPSSNFFRNPADLNLDELAAVSGVDLGSVNLNDQGVVTETIFAMLTGFFCLGDTLSLEQVRGLGLDADVQLLLLLAQLAQLELRGLLDFAGAQGVMRSSVVKGRRLDLAHFKREIAEVTKTARRMKKVRRYPRTALQKRQCPAVVGTVDASLDSSNIEVITVPPIAASDLASLSPTSTSLETRSTTVTASDDAQDFVIATAPIESCHAAVVTGPTASTASHLQGAARPNFCFPILTTPAFKTPVHQPLQSFILKSCALCSLPFLHFAS